MARHRRPRRTRGPRDACGRPPRQRPRQPAAGQQLLPQRRVLLARQPRGPRIDNAYFRSVDCFREAARLFTPVIEPVEIPFEGTVLHGYVYRPAQGEGPLPVLVCHSGFDGTAEEMHFFGAAAAAARGYLVVSFDGPGQPAARHRDGLVFWPDWEKVVGPVLDWLLARPDVDPERVALLGLSMGGLLAPRTAAFEPRLAACIAVDGVCDLGITATGFLPGDREQAERMLRAEQAPEVDAGIAAAMEHNPVVRWAATHGCYVMGTPTPRAFLASYLDYTLDGTAEKITCPTLVCEAEDDLFFRGQPELLFDHLTCQRTLMRFTDADGAGAHCHGGAQRLACPRILDWLDETLTGPRRCPAI
jgi:dienelactone hydrolase